MSGDAARKGGGQSLPPFSPPEYLVIPRKLMERLCQRLPEAEIDFSLMAVRVVARSGEMDPRTATDYGLNLMKQHAEDQATLAQVAQAQWSARAAALGNLIEALNMEDSRDPA